MRGEELDAEQALAAHLVRVGVRLRVRVGVRVGLGLGLEFRGVGLGG